MVMIKSARNGVALGTRTTPRLAAIIAASMLALFGAGLVLGIGFAGADVLHNVAHDTRHANGFPCH